MKVRTEAQRAAPIKRWFKNYYPPAMYDERIAKLSNRELIERKEQLEEELDRYFIETNQSVIESAAMNPKESAQCFWKQLTLYATKEKKKKYAIIVMRFLFAKYPQVMDAPI
jgi:hypothetical protein